MPRSLPVTLWTGLALIAMVNLLAAADGTTYPAPAYQGSGIVFPNQAYWDQSSPASAIELADILVRAHQSAMGARQHLVQRSARTEEQRRQLEEVYGRNLETARMAIGLMERRAAEQGASQMTIYYATRSSDIPRNSEVHAKLGQFADELVNMRQGRQILITSIGSNSPRGSEAGAAALALDRATPPADILARQLGSAPHRVHLIDSQDGLYGPQGARSDVTVTSDQQYQSTRLLAVFAPLGATPAEALATARAAAAAAPAAVSAQVFPAGLANVQVSQVSSSARESLGIWRNHLGMDFAYIPPGSFVMGSPDGEYRRDPDERQHRVTISRGFYMQTTEVTQGQWKAVMGANPSHFSDCGWECPVDSVSWLDAQKFIDRLNGAEKSLRYRLPTEAEWEYACRAGSTGPFAGIDTVVDDEQGFSGILDRVGWYHRNSANTPHPVGTRQPNPWGLFDMHGNVWEWCSDWYGEYPVVDTTDPVGPASSDSRVRRGGAWNHYAEYCRAGDRSRSRPEEGSPEAGFRLVREAIEPVLICPEPAAAVPAPAPAPAPAPVNPCEIRSEANGIATLRVGIPDAGNQGVAVQREVPTVVPVGQEVSYTIRLYNHGQCPVQRVVLTEQPGAGFQVRSTNPPAQNTPTGGLRWVVEPLAPGAVHAFVVTGSMTRPGDLQHCATVEYTQHVCSTMRGVQPELKLTMDAPAEALLCETIPVRLTVSNTGTGSATNVNLTVNLPEGIAAADGQRTATLAVGDLHGAQTRDFALNLKAARVGSYRLQAAAAGDGLRVDAVGVVNVRSPRLQLAAQLPASQFAGRPVQYLIDLRNTGDAPAAAVTVQTTLAPGMSVLEVSNQGRQSGNLVTWQLPSIAAGSGQQLTLSLRPDQPGSYATVTTAAATCADTVNASSQIDVRGVAAILLEVADETDPLQVGKTGSYVIVATNQGTVASTNVRIACKLEDSMKFVSATGATTGALDRGRIVFAPLPTLEANGKATWRVTVEALKAGDVRFWTELNSDQLQRPVEETEATTVY